MKNTIEEKGMKNDEVRWQIVKALLDEFPPLKERVKKYLETLP